MKKKTGFCQAAWLIVAQGGWWTAKEIIELIPLGISIDAAYPLLWSMVHRDGTLARRGGLKNTTYAVLPDCKIPKGITLRELMKAIT